MKMMPSGEFVRTPFDHGRSSRGMTGDKSPEFGAGRLSPRFCYVAKF